MPIVLRTCTVAGGKRRQYGMQAVKPMNNDMMNRVETKRLFTLLIVGEARKDRVHR